MNDWILILINIVTLLISISGSFYISHRKIQSGRKDKLEDRLRVHGEDIAKLKDRTDNYKEIEKVVYSQRADNQPKKEIE